MIFNQSGDIHLRDVDQFRCVEDKFDGHKFNEIKITLYIKRKYETIQLLPNEYICVEISNCVSHADFDLSVLETCFMNLRATKLEHITVVNQY